MIECNFFEDCLSRNTDKCNYCKYNTRRNYMKDYFVNANDNVLQEKPSKLTYEGPAEQTAGYCCPVCGGYTNPYQLVDKNCCKHCGYRLNI